MIQRIQTIWLLLAAVSISALFYVDVYSVTIPTSITTAQQADYMKVINIKNNFLALGLTGVSAALSVFTIFLFKNRKQQASLIWLNIFLCIGLLVWLYMGLNAFWNNYPTNGGNIFIGLFLPAVTIFLLILALRGIRKDQKLLKSLDRLR